MEDNTIIMEYSTWRLIAVFKLFITFTSKLGNPQLEVASNQLGSSELKDPLTMFSHEYIYTYIAQFDCNYISTHN